DKEANSLGRYIPGDGTYHPFKYVCGQLRSSLRGSITLYTRTRVRRIVSVHNDEHHVVTERGTISARRVIVATNAFTRDLLRELARIEPYQSQIMITEHVGDRGAAASSPPTTDPCSSINRVRARAMGALAW